MRMGRCRGRLGGGITLLIPAVWEFFRGVVRTGFSCIYRNRFILVKVASSYYPAFPYMAARQRFAAAAVCSPVHVTQRALQVSGHLGCIGIPIGQPAPTLLNETEEHLSIRRSLPSSKFEWSRFCALSCTNRQIPTAFRRGGVLKLSSSRFGGPSSRTPQGSSSLSRSGTRSC